VGGVRARLKLEIRSNRFYDRLDRHVTAVDSEVNPGFVVDDEIFLNCNDKTVAFLCSTSLF